MTKSQEMLDKYKEYLSARNLSTVHYNFMRIWLTYLDKNNVEILNISQETITKFFSINNYAKNTFNSFIRAGRHFYNFLGCSQDTNEWYKMNYSTIHRRIPTCLVVEEIERLIRYICSEHEDLMMPIKVEALIWFMFYSGLRKDEILTLKRSDIDYSVEPIAVKLIGKGDKQRIVYISEKYAPKFKTKLKRYFDASPEKDNAFNLTKGKLEYLMGIMRQYMPDKKISPHLFRHSFARYLLDKGVPITYVSWLLGHSDIKTTMIYAHPTDDMIKNFMT
jgi:site-specific recombinase XerD